MLRVTQLSEIVEKTLSNVVDLATGRPIVFLPAETADFIAMRTRCLVCGRTFWWAKPVGQRGRYRRFCSDQCSRDRDRLHNRAYAWRQRRAGTLDLFDQPIGEHDDETR